MAKILNFDEKAKFATNVTINSMTTQKGTELVTLEFNFQIPSPHPLIPQDKEQTFVVVSRVAVPKEVYDEHVRNYLAIRKAEMERAQ
ncbi:MAG: hypothetical protein HYT70_03010 [Candidatus Aenigmarchaeota archaeon]|nr:hypothetical protein [Candidatus Aenigmarchaeota archaeon]